MKTSEPVNILVVDDVPEKIMAIEATLAELGQNIVKAYSGREALALPAQRRLRRHPARRQHARDGRLRDGRVDSRAQTVRAHADHFHHGVQRRSADGQGLFARRRGLHFDADRPGRAADQGRRVRRSVSKDGDDPPAGGAPRATGARAGGPAGGRKGDAALRAAGRSQPAAFPLARFRRHAGQLAPHGGSGAGRRLPARAVRCE